MLSFCFPRLAKHELFSYLILSVCLDTIWQEIDPLCFWELLGHFFLIVQATPSKVLARWNLQPPHVPGYNHCVYFREDFCDSSRQSDCEVAEKICFSNLFIKGQYFVELPFTAIASQGLFGDSLYQLFKSKDWNCHPFFLAR